VATVLFTQALQLGDPIHPAGAAEAAAVLVIVVATALLGERLAPRLLGLSRPPRWSGPG